jgi:replicative DNA helicase
VIRIVGEQETLGTLLLSKAAIANVIDVWRIDDFHHPAHRLIYDCIRELYQRGQPADPVTVTIELDRRGDLFSAGGAAYLHTLISMVPPVGGRERFV